MKNTLPTGFAVHLGGFFDAHHATNPQLFSYVHCGGAGVHRKGEIAEGSRAVHVLSLRARYVEQHMEHVERLTQRNGA